MMLALNLLDKLLDKDTSENTESFLEPDHV
jgi:hypothetical protein